MNFKNICMVVLVAIGLGVTGCDNSTKTATGSLTAGATDNLNSANQYAVNNSFISLPAGVTITAPTLTATLVSTLDTTYGINVDGKIASNGLLVKVPYHSDNDNVALKDFTSNKFIISANNTSNNDSGVVVVFKWSGITLSAGDGYFNAKIALVGDSNTYYARQLDITASSYTTATLSYPTDENSIMGTLSLKVIPGIPDRNFNVLTNGVYEHKFLYLPVTNPITGRTWLNNNLGAEYADANNPNGNFNPKQQATANNDYKAYGSLFQWGREADGHELFDWTGATAGTAKHGDTNVTNDNPSDSLFITSNGDWRVTPDDTLWATESSANNVCPVGYRLPLDLNGADDAENELAVELNSWDSKDANGSISSDLKLPMAGGRVVTGDRDWTASYGIYWTGSVVPSDGNNNTASKARDIYFGNILNLLDISSRAYAFSVRCIKDQTPAERSDSILKEIGNEHSNNNSTITVAQLKAITPALDNIEEANEKWYQSYIEGSDTHFSSPATRAEVQTMIDKVNTLNLPTNAILDRNFYKKTNGKFEHKFVYLAVTNPNTGRTWLNNNLGADYANVDSSAYNVSQQATAGNDHLAYGSLFQWGREADGHELFDWTGATAGTAKHGDTDVTNNNPSDSLFIKQRNWRVTPNDTLWASESSANNVCPVGYRLPLNPNGAVDAENELVVELNSWDSKDADGSMLSDLKLPMAGGRKTNGDRAWTASYGIYWSGSVVPSDGNNSTVSNARDIYFGRALGLLDTSARGYGLSVRCIKEQTPAERSASTLLEIGNEHNSHKSTVTVAQLKAITPALENVNDNYENIYRTYIASADTNIGSPATIEELQSMIDEVNSFNLPEHAILDRSFFKKTNGAFEHRFVYLPVTNPKTGRTWLNNNLGAEYANVDSSAYNASQQATTSNDHLAYGSLFQWGREADGHELINRISNTDGEGKYGTTTTKADNPSGSLFIGNRSFPFDWRVNRDDTLWANESSANNICPTGYRLPLNPNGTEDSANEFYQESNTWSSQDNAGAFSSSLKLTAAGHRSRDDGAVNYEGSYGFYWGGSVTGVFARRMIFNSRAVYPNYSYRAYGFSVRCIKQNTMKENNSLPANITIDSTSLEANVVSTSNQTPDIQGVVDSGSNTLTISVPYTVSNEATTLPAYSKTYTIATADTEDGVADIVATFSWSEQLSLAVGSGTFNATITTNVTYNAKKLDIEDDEAGKVVATFNYPTDDAGSTGRATLKVLPGILDRNFNVQTNDKYEHRFIYMPVTNPITGRTWLNNNLGAEYANINSSAFNPTQQATASNDYKAYGSLFQWGRKADGHELMNWTNGATGAGKYGETSTKADDPSDSLFIENSSFPFDWRVNRDDTLWANESSANNVCPIGYRLPLNPNGAEDSANEFYQESKTWSSQDNAGALSSFLKMPAAGCRYNRASLGYYWSGSVNEGYARRMFFNSSIMNPNSYYYRMYGFSVRCIKN